MQGRFDESAKMVTDLKKQRISTDREIKHHRAWVQAELTERAMAAQAQQVEGIMPDLAAMKEQVIRVEQEAEISHCPLLKCGQGSCEEGRRHVATHMQISHI